MTVEEVVYWLAVVDAVTGWARRVDAHAVVRRDLFMAQREASFYLHQARMIRADTSRFRRELGEIHFRACVVAWALFREGARAIEREKQARLAVPEPFLFGTVNTRGVRRLKLFREDTAVEERDRLETLRALSHAGLEWSTSGEPGVVVGGTSITTASGIVLFEEAFAIELGPPSFEASVAATRGYRDSEQTFDCLKDAVEFVIGVYRERGLLRRGK